MQPAAVHLHATAPASCACPPLPATPDPHTAPPPTLRDRRGAALPPGAASLVVQLDPTPMQRCLALNAFLVLTVGAAAPLLLLRLLQRSRKVAGARSAERGAGEGEWEREQQRASPESCARYLVLGYCVLGATWAVACILA